MFDYKNRFKKAAIGMSLAAMLAVGVTAPALAADTVTGTVTSGSLTASIADLTLGSVAYSHNSQTTSGTMALTVDDSTGTGDGWNVTVLASAFVYSGDNGGTNIAASNLAFNTLAAPVYVDGQAIDGINGPLKDGANDATTLDSARRVIYANAEYGSGQYTQNLPVVLTIPETSRAGTYTSTLTVTAAAGPGA
ncbi:hypothetical protein BH23CHL2_BH23CHL2_32680 [soil metagenome]